MKKSITMTFVYYFKVYVFLTLSSFCACFMNAQSQNDIVYQDAKFEQLLNEKRKINTFLNINDSYKVQIFAGDSENAKKVLILFRQQFADIDATIIFNTPNYKVWVGSFRNRIGAEKFVADLRIKFKNVILIKPAK